MVGWRVDWGGVKHFDQLLGGYETIFQDAWGGTKPKVRAKFREKCRFKYLRYSIINKDHINI